MGGAISVAFWAVFPLVCLIAIGCFLRMRGFFNDDNIVHPNNLCFKVFLPATLFSNIYSSDFSTDFNATLIIFAVSCVVISFVSLMLFIPKIENDDKKRAVMIQGIFRSNFLFFGLSVVGSIFGESGISISSILGAFVIPVYNALSVFVLEKYCGKKPGIKNLLVSMSKNPLIVSSIIAFAFVLTGIKLPVPIADLIGDIGSVSTPLALILIGGGFKLVSTKGFLKQLVISVIGKLIIVPLIFVPIAFLMSFSGQELTALLIMFASPTAVSSYTMAQNAHAAPELAGQIVVFTTAVSLFTIFSAIVLFGMLGIV